MSEKRFEYIDDDLEPLCKDNENDGEVIHWKKVVDLLNEQQDQIKVYEEGLTMKIKKINEQKALITNLQGDVNRLQYIIDELKKDNYKRFEKINELQAKLREKEEDAQLYAKEIVKLNKEAKEVLEFKSLGGDY